MKEHDKQGKINLKFYMASLVVFFCYVILGLARNFKHTRSVLSRFFEPDGWQFIEWINVFWFIFDAVLTLVFGFFLLRFFLAYFRKQSCSRQLKLTLIFVLVDTVLNFIIFAVTNINVLANIRANDDSEALTEFLKNVISPANILSFATIIFLILLLIGFRKENGRRLLNLTMILLLASIICGMVVAVYVDSVSYITAIKAGNMTVLRYIKRMVIDFGLGFGASILPVDLLLFNSAHDYREFD